MFELQVPSAVKIKVSEDGSEITISGKLGSTVKHVNRSFLTVKLEGSKVTVENTANAKLAKRGELAGQALTSEITSAIAGVETGVERKLRMVYAHFPMSVEIKGKEVLVKNMFGEKYPRVAKIEGDTKVEVKGSDLTVKGVDNYDVGQTAANIRKLSFVRKKDTRVFQDGIYEIGED